MKFRSIRFKVSILYTVILGLILLSYSLLLYFNLNYVVFHEIDSKLKKKIAEVERIIDLYSSAYEPEKEGAAISLRRALHLEEQESSEVFQWPSVKKIDQRWRLTTEALGMKQDYIVITSPTGEIVEKSYNVDNDMLAALTHDFQLTFGIRTSIRNLTFRDRQLRLISQPLYRSGKIKYVLLLATPTESHHILLKSKLTLIMVSIPLFLLGTIFMGAFFVQRVFKPVKEITAAAQQITHKDMSKRVKLEHTDDEIKSLVEAFNDMISRLEKSFRHIEDFSSNVAHELKTPLAIIRGELEVTLRKDRTPEEYRRSIQVALEETQKVLKTINDLLLLAKLDYHPEIFKFEPLELNDFLKEIHEQSQLMADNKSITVRLQTNKLPLTISADQLHLRRLFLNLIDNAIKFTPVGGRIDIHIAKKENCGTVTVRDTGIGIKPEDLPKIFDRFFSTPETDPSSLATGLGLSIVQTIAKIHNGAVSVTSQPGKGAAFTVSFPLLSSSSAS